MENAMILAIVQARMSSTRLPGKTMKEVLGKPLIGHLLERLKKSKKIDKIVLATPTHPCNDSLCHYAVGQGIDVFRGSEEDVLDRFYQAASKYSPTTIVRITADCPLMDFKLVDRVIEFYEAGKYDYVSNAAVEPAYPDGMDVEVFSMRALEAAWKEASLLSEREHVTPYISKSDQFHKGNFHAERDYSGERWTVDNEEDFVLVKNILENLYKEGSYFDLQDILHYKESHPSIFAINRHIGRNEGYQKSLNLDNLEKIFIEEGAADSKPAFCSRVIFFSPQEDRNFFRENIPPDRYYRVYEEVYDTLLNAFHERHSDQIVIYRGVDLLWCFKKDLFEYANDLIQRDLALRLALERYPTAQFWVEKKQPDFVHLNIYQVIDGGYLRSSGRFRFTEPRDNRSGHTVLKVRNAWKDLFWPGRILKGNLAKAQTVVFSDYTKTKNIIRRFTAGECSFYTHSLAPKIFLEALRQGIPFFQAVAPKKDSKFYTEKAAVFLQKIRDQRTFYSVVYTHADLGLLLAPKIEALFSEILPKLLLEIDHMHDFFVRSKSLKTALLDEDISFSKNAFCQVARQYKVKSYVSCHGALGLRTGFLPLTADCFFAWGETGKKKLEKWGCPANRVIVTGCSHYDYYQRLDEGAVRQKVCRNLGLDSAKKIVLLAFNPIEKLGFFYDYQMVETIRWAIKTVYEFSSVQFILKVHPGDRSGYFYEDQISRFPGKMIVLRRYDPMLLAKAADFLVVYMSTYAIDGFAMKKNVICLRDDLLSPLEEFDPFGIFYDVRDSSGLRQAMKEFLQNNAAPKGLWQEAREQCLNELPKELSAEERIVAYARTR